MDELKKYLPCSSIQQVVDEANKILPEGKYENWSPYNKARPIFLYRAKLGQGGYDAYTQHGQLIEKYFVGEETKSSLSQNVGDRFRGDLLKQLCKESESNAIRHQSLTPILYGIGTISAIAAYHNFQSGNKKMAAAMAVASIAAFVLPSLKF